MGSVGIGLAKIRTTFPHRFPDQRVCKKINTTRDQHPLIICRYFAYHKLSSPIRHFPSRVLSLFILFERFLEFFTNKIYSNLHSALGQRISTVFSLHRDLHEIRQLIPKLGKIGKINPASSEFCQRCFLLASSCVPLPHFQMCKQNQS